MKILVYVDGGKDSRVAVEHACKLAQGGGYETGYHTVLLCAVCQDSKNPMSRLSSLGQKLHIKEGGGGDAHYQELRTEAQNIIDDHISMDKCLEDVKHESFPLVGKPSHEIVALAAQEKVDRIVMGRHSKGEKKLKMRLGSIAKSVIRHVPKGAQVHIVEFGSEIVKRYPVQAVDTARVPSMRVKAVKLGFSEEAATKLVDLFVFYDDDHGGDLDLGELDELFTDLGIDIEDETVQEQIKRVDRDNSATLEYEEYMKLMFNLSKWHADKHGIPYDKGVSFLKATRPGKKHSALHSFLKTLTGKKDDGEEDEEGDLH